MKNAMDELREKAGAQANGAIVPVVQRYAAGDYLGAIDEGERLLAELVSNRAACAITHYFLGLTHAKIGNHEDAIDAFDKCMDQGFSGSECWANIGNSHLARVEFAAAAAAFERALAISPADAVARRNLPIARSLISAQSAGVLEVPDGGGPSRR